MSYCVNCGVELDKTCEICPLCGTAVYNPNQPVDFKSPKPYPEKKGIIDSPTSYEFTILMSIILGTIAIVCGLLNHVLPTNTRWSFYVIGICILIWIFLLPVFFPKKVPIFAGLLLNGGSIAIFGYMISDLHPGKGWYPEIALPIIVIGTILVLNFYGFTIHKKSSFITKTALLFGSFAILFPVVEILMDLHFQGAIFLTWSLVILACCISIDIVLITISFLTGVRGELRKRLHF